jgi:hypothetical protein
MLLEPFFTQPVTRVAVPGESRLRPLPQISQRYGEFAQSDMVGECIGV